MCSGTDFSQAKKVWCVNKQLMVYTNLHTYVWETYCWEIVYSTVPNKRVAVIRVLPKEFPKKYNSQGSNNCLSYDI